MAAVTTGLTQAQRDRFAREGFLVVQDALDPARDVAPVMTEYEQVLISLAADLQVDGGGVSRAEPTFSDGLIEIWEKTGRGHAQHFDICLPSKGIRPDTPIHTGPAVFALLTNPRLLDLLEGILGPEISSNPVQHVRIKLPQGVLSRSAALKDGTASLTGRAPWHQDTGVLLPEADESQIVTVWIPLNSATVENGCLQVVPRSHLGDIAPHCPGDGLLAIPDKYVPLDDAVALPMEPGSVLLMHQRTIHSSLDNLTAREVRISLDLRYQPTGKPIGRPMLASAGFVARSWANPAAELHDSRVWSRRWIDVRDRLAGLEAPASNRWSSDHEACA